MQHKREAKPSKTENIIQEFFDKIINIQLNRHKRPPYLPPYAPDCGWNHGEQEKGNVAKD
jgi:hypothetical protein